MESLPKIAFLTERAGIRTPDNLIKSQSLQSCARFKYSSF